MNHRNPKTKLLKRMTERQPYKRDLEDLEMQSGHK